MSPVSVRASYATLRQSLNPPFGYGFPTVRALTRLSVTPVKALRLSHPQEADLTVGGIPADRRFYLIDEDGGLFDASDLGALMQVVPHYDPGAERLQLSFPDGSVVEDAADRLAGAVTTDFFGRMVHGDLLEGGLGPALSAFAGRPVRLARVTRDGDGQDVHPLTIVSSESIRDLGRRGDRSDLDARRFRINLEIEGGEPYEEDSWDGGLVRVGGATIRVRGQIPRCVVTTLAPETGDKDFGTLTHLARYRPRIGGRGGLPFGMYAEVERAGRVRIGDPVEPVSSRPAEKTSVADR
jgi:uncharacterized protein YcbX